MAQLLSGPFGRVEETEITANSSSRNIWQSITISIKKQCRKWYTYRKHSSSNLPDLCSLSLFTTLDWPKKYVKLYNWI